MVRVVTLSVLALLPFAPGAAQQPVPIQELVDHAHVALNNLEYARAASIARTLLETGAEGHLDVEITALRLLAAALYPEEPRMQRRDSTLVYLNRLIWATPDARIPRSISWPGLDSLLERTRRHAFVVWAGPESLYVFHGVAAHAVVPVRTSRPALVHLSLALEGTKNPMLLDSAFMTSQGGLTIRMVDGDRVSIPSGRYELRVVAVDTASGQAVKRRYRVTVDAPSLVLLDTAATADTVRLLNERGPRRPVRNALIGLGLGAVTGIIATAFRGGGDLGSTPPDGRAILVGATMSLSAIIGAVADRGRSLPDNVRHNQAIRSEIAERREAAHVENDRRRRAYTAAIVVHGEIR